MVKRSGGRGEIKESIEGLESEMLQRRLKKLKGKEKKEKKSLPFIAVGFIIKPKPFSLIIK